MFHVDIRSGSLFGGQSAHDWDLDEGELHEKFLDPRERGQEIWVQGQSFSWNEAKLQIYEGPPAAEIEDFSQLLGPAAYAMSGALEEALSGCSSACRPC